MEHVFPQHLRKHRNKKEGEIIKIKSKFEKIINSKKKGFGNIALLIGIILPFLLVVLFYVVTLFIAGEQVATIKDRADFANLATYKDINQQELSTEGNITFEDTDLTNAFNTYTISLRDNFNLDTNLKVINQNTFIEGNIIVNKLILYKVKNGLTTAWEYDHSTGNFTNIYKNSSGEVLTPNNKTVVNTSVYSEIIVPTAVPIVGTQNLTVRSYTDAVH